MEQQTVTIAKAGIHAALNARCSVVAAANPVYGQYDKTRRPQDNIGLPDSLLSRFDLLFIVLDQLDPQLDRTLSEHVIHSHLYRRPGTIMEPEALNQTSSLQLLEDHYEDMNARQDTPVWLRNSNASSSSSSSSTAAAATNSMDEDGSDVLHKEFLRKYIHYAKHRIVPVLSEEAMERISNAYAGMRAQQSRKNLPITARTLETMIRLSTAAAKCRLSEIIEIDDVEMAVELLNFVLFHDIGNTVQQQQQQQQAKKEIAKEDEDDVTSNDEGDDEEEEDIEAVQGDDLEEEEVTKDGSTVSAADKATIRTAILRVLDDMIQQSQDSITVYELKGQLFLHKKSSSSLQSLLPTSVHRQDQLFQELLQSLEQDNKVSVEELLLLFGHLSY